VSAPSAAPRRVGRAGSEGGVASDTNTNRLRGDGVALVRARGAGTKHNACTARTETASERRDGKMATNIAIFPATFQTSFKTHMALGLPSSELTSVLHFSPFFHSPSCKAQQKKLDIEV
jgi:hypothetical protein